MFENLIKNFKSYVHFNEEELVFFLSLFEFRVIKKDKKLLQVGQVCNYVSYINNGLMRYSHVIDNTEHTVAFFPENMWVSDYGSFLVRKPSDIAIEALEDTELFLLSYDAVQRAYEKNKVFERFGRIMAERLFLNLVDGASDMRQKSPETRYMELIENHPQIINSVPLKYIASYLGITPESFSRIRKRISTRS